MRAIPPALRAEMEVDPYYKKCAITGATSEKIDWHHNLIFAGRQVNEKFCIIPLAKSIHDDIVKHKEKVDWIMLNRATEEELRRYSKVVDYVRMKEVLNEKYGHYTAR